MYHYKSAGGGFSFGLTTGMIFIPILLGIGIGMIFYNSNTRISMQTMTSFDLIVILVLAFGGTGLFLRSLKEQKSKGW